MKLSILALFSLCFLGCIDEYSDSIVLRNDGSATFVASIYPCKPDSAYIDNVRANYNSITGLKFDSAWFSQKDSLYALNFKLSFENLFLWQGDKMLDKDFIGNISLKKIDSLKNGYSFERIINPNTESAEGEVVPEENIPDFVLEQMSGNDSAFSEYTLVLPPGATLINSELTDTVRWKIPTIEAISKRISLKADFYLPEIQQKPGIQWEIIVGAALGCIILLLATFVLIRKLLRVSLALKELKNAEKNFKGE